MTDRHQGTFWMTPEFARESDECLLDLSVLRDAHAMVTYDVSVKEVHREDGVRFVYLRIVPANG